jgi:hypothetical protein
MIYSLTCNTLMVEGCVVALRIWGLEWMISKSIIHTDLHKRNNKLVNTWLEHFWCTNEPRAYMDP